MNAAASAVIPVAAHDATPAPVSLGRTVAEIRKLLPGSGLQEAARTSVRDVSRHRSQIVGKFYGATISTQFQPWRRPQDGAIVAVEAYARSQSRAGEGLSPWQSLADAAVDVDLVLLDRLCRTVHALNFFAPAGAASALTPLVLNVDARLLHAVPERHGEFFGKVLGLLGVSPKQIVIDIRTHQLLDLSRLRQILASYRRHGFKVAVNADGMIHARSLADLLAPDILMLDALQFTPERLARHAASLVRGGVQVAVKRIETAGQLAAAKDASVAWIQGFHLDMPAAETAAVAPKKSEI